MPIYTYIYIYIYIHVIVLDWISIVLILSDIFECRIWKNQNTTMKSRHPNLHQLYSKLPSVIIQAKSSSTTRKYRNEFIRWRSWCTSMNIVSLPSTVMDISLYLLSVLQHSHTSASVFSAYYGIKWAHDLAGFTDISSDPLPKMVLEASKRILRHRTIKKDPVTPQMLNRLVKKHSRKTVPKLVTLVGIYITFVRSILAV